MGYSYEDPCIHGMFLDECIKCIHPPVTDDNRDRLYRLIKELSFKERHDPPFTLCSGQTSPYMVDLSTSLRTDEGQRALAWMMMTALPPHGHVMGGPLNGSDLVAQAASRAGLCKRWFGVRKEPKNRGFDTEEITGILEPGDRVWMVEDVCTTGSSLERACSIAVQNGATIEGLFAVVDRGGLVELGKQQGLPTVSLFTLKDFIDEP